MGEVLAIAKPKKKRRTRRPDLHIGRKITINKRQEAEITEIIDVPGIRSYDYSVVMLVVKHTGD